MVTLITRLTVVGLSKISNLKCFPKRAKLDFSLQLLFLLLVKSFIDSHFQLHEDMNMRNIKYPNINRAQLVD